MYCLGGCKIRLDLVFFGKLVLGIVFENDVKGINIISGIEGVDREPEVKVYWDLLQLNWYPEAIIAS